MKQAFNISSIANGSPKGIWEWALWLEGCAFFILILGLGLAIGSPKNVKLLIVF
jgi:hypothetical protein